MTIEQPLQEGNSKVTLTFEPGDIDINFYWQKVVLGGMKSPEPLIIPNDTDHTICDYLEVVSILRYDHRGTETNIKVTPEIENEFKRFVASRDLLECDEYCVD